LVKSDTIIPHHYTFYELLNTKAVGVSGPLDVWEGEEKDKIATLVERRYYEKNKHIFPCKTWELYDPNTHKKSDKPNAVDWSKVI